MQRNRFIKLQVALFVMLFSLAAIAAHAGEIPRMNKEELAKKMDSNSVVVVDVRSGRDWKSSEFKIKGAIRVDKDIVKWAAQYPKDTTMTLYCA